MRPITTLLAGALALLCLTPALARADFGLLPGDEGFGVSASASDGSARAEVAGSHPYALSTEINLNEGPPSPGQPGVAFSDGDLRDLSIDLPPGLIENPSVIPRCSGASFHTPRLGPGSLSGESCPAKSQIGTVSIRTSEGGGETRTFGVFNLTPPRGSPSRFGFSPYGAPVTIAPRVREAGSEYGLTLDLRNFPQRFDTLGLRLVIWGTPWSLAHDGERGDCLNEAEPSFPLGKCSVGPVASNPPQAYLTLPSSCAGPLTFHLSATSWQGGSLSRSHLEPPLRECETATFAPLPRARFNTDRAGSPSGFDFEIAGDTDGLLEPDARAASQVKRVVLRLPAGMSINPSVGAGLGACGPAQFAAETVSSLPGAGCPNDSEIGELTVKSPLFEGEVKGGMYLAEPDDPESPGAENPFGSLLALYLIAKAPDRGVMVKLAGQVDADPRTGQLTATFDGLPQLPYSSFDVHFRDGQRTPLATPPTCGHYASSTELSPWLAPSTRLSIPTEFDISAGIGGGPCPVGIPPFAPRAVAGTLNRAAGTYSPFYLRLTRGDADQEITSYSSQLPPGLLGKLKGIPFCPEAAIDAARQRPGFAEQRDPSCPAASSIGHTVSGYGLGNVLAYAPGGLYLAGPYHGAPLSIVAVDSATVGPFDLGVIVVRSAIRIDPKTAQVSVDSAGSDPIPHIIRGIPIHLRDVRVYIDRPGFTLNPTSCQRFSATSTLSGSGGVFDDPGDDSLASASAPFQVSNCSGLEFDPRFSLVLRGGTERGDYPALQAVLRPWPGDANLAKAVVALPSSIFLAQENIDTICTRRQFAAERCPPGSVYGTARAVTPLLGVPLEGPVYLRASDTTLPDLVADLSGGGIEIEVAGKIDSIGGGLRATFNVLPDAPVTKFTMRLRGGKHSLLVASEDLCAHRPRAKARFIGQNNGYEGLTPRLRTECHGRRGAKKTKKKGGRR